MVADEEAFHELTEETQPMDTMSQRQHRLMIMENSDFRTWFGWLLVGIAVLAAILIVALTVSASDRANIKSRTDLANQCMISGGSWTSHGDCIRK